MAANKAGWAHRAVSFQRSAIGNPLTASSQSLVARRALLAARLWRMHECAHNETGLVYANSGGEWRGRRCGVRMQRTSRCTSPLCRSVFEMRLMLRKGSAEPRLSTHLAPETDPQKREASAFAAWHFADASKCALINGLRISHHEGTCGKADQTLKAAQGSSGRGARAEPPPSPHVFMMPAR